MDNNPFADLIPSQQQGAADNPFHDLIPGNAAPQQVQEPSLVQKALGTLNAVATGFNAPFQAIAGGVLKGIGQVTGSEGLVNAVNQVRADEKQDYANAVAEHPIATRVGYAAGLAGTIAPQVVAAPTSVLGQGLAGAAMGGLTSEADSLGGRAAEAVAGGVLGSALAKGVGMVANMGKPGSTAAGVLAQSGPGMNRVAEAERLGTFITPGEATGDTVLKAAEGRIPVTDKLVNIANDALSQRDTVLKGQLGKLVDSVVPEGVDTAKKTANALYSKAYGTQLADDEVASLVSNPVIQKAIARATGDVSNPINQMQPGSVGYFDMIKRELDDMSGMAKMSGQKNQQSLASEALNSLKGALDNASPEYAQAREISQRVILQRSMTDALSKVKLKPGEDTLTLDQMYNTLAGSGKQQSKLLDAVAKGGGDVDQAKSVLDVINAVRSSPITKLSGKNPDGASLGGGLYEELKKYGTQLVAGKYNEKLLRAAIDPNKAESLKDLLSQRISSDTASKVAVGLRSLLVD